jgi:hypothetical protein
LAVFIGLWESANGMLVHWLMPKCWREQYVSLPWWVWHESFNTCIFCNNIWRFTSRGTIGDSDMLWLSVWYCCSLYSTWAKVPTISSPLYLI